MYVTICLQPFCIELIMYLIYFGAIKNSLGVNILPVYKFVANNNKNP